MKRYLGTVFLLSVLCGCAQMCEFGQDGAAPGLKCYRVFSKAEIGMTSKEVEQRIGSPQTRRIDVSYRGQTYDEVWVYETTPHTILYFKNGVLKHKEYEQKTTTSFEAGTYGMPRN